MNNNNTILVSVCIQTFNQKNYIKQCLDGVLMQQTNFSIEIILGEDDSSDGTREICIDYAEKHSEQIRLFLRDRKDVIFIGGNATGRFNFIENLKESKGKYIALCEGDDYWTDPLKLQKQVDFLESNSEFSGCFHYTQTIYENGKKGRVFGFHPDKFDFDAESTFSKCSLFHTSSFVFLKSALELPNWLSKVVSGDMAIFSIIAAKGKLKCIPEEMSVYRKHEGGITNTSNIINNYHSQRIDLINYLNGFHDFKYKIVAEKIINFHKSELKVSYKLEKWHDKFIRKIKRLIHG